MRQKQYGKREDNKMFERLVNFIKGAINKMFNTTDIAKDFNIDISTSNEINLYCG